MLRLASTYLTALPGGNGRSWHLLSETQSPRGLQGLPIRRFNACSASQDLKMKKCVPCNTKDIRPMTEQTANELLKQVQDWRLLCEDSIMKLQKSWKVKNFSKGLEFFQRVADIAETEGHHPDLHLVGWNNVQIEIWTHSVGGLTENDFILAAKINSIGVEDFLRNKPASFAV